MAGQVEIVGVEPASNTRRRAEVNAGNSLNVNVTEQTTTFSQDYSGAQSNLTIITPSAGKKLHIERVFVSTSTTATDVTLDFATTGNVVFKLYTAQIATTAGIPCHHDGQTNESLRLTCGAKTFVCVDYYEHD